MRNILPDTSVAVEFLRRNEPVFTRFRRLREEGQLVLGGVVLCELLSGVRDERQREQIALLQSALDYVEATREVFVRAGHLGARLRAKGALIPFSDLLVAATALHHGLRLWTRDAHFRKVPGLLFFD